MSWKSYSVLHVCEDGLDEPKTSHRKSVASRFILVTRPQPHSKSCAVLQKGEEGKRFCPLSKAMVKTWSPGRGGSGRALFLSSVARGEYRHPHWHEGSTGTLTDIGHGDLPLVSLKRRIMWVGCSCDPFQCSSWGACFGLLFEKKKTSFVGKQNPLELLICQEFDVKTSEFCRAGHIGQ